METKLSPQSIPQDDPVNIERLSHTSLTHFSKSPLHFLFYKENKPEPTPDMIHGKAGHCKILQSEQEFKDKFFVMDLSKRPVPDSDFKVKANQVWKKEQILAAADKDVITSDILIEILNQQDSLMNHKPARELMELLTGRERKLEWTDPDTGLNMISYLDGDNNDFIIDLKFVQNASNEQFAKDCYNKKYFRQAGTYVDGCRIAENKNKAFYFICIEKEAPYAVSVQKCSRKLIEHGRLHYGNLLSDFQSWDEAGRPKQGYEWRRKGFGGYYELELPNWIKG